MEQTRVNSYTSIDELKVAVEMQKEINELTAKKNAEPEPSGKPKSKFLGIDMSRENAQALASDLIQYVNDEHFDERALEDDRYKRDNQMVIDSAIPGDTVILRTEDGRCA